MRRRGYTRTLGRLRRRTRAPPRRSGRRRATRARTGARSPRGTIVDCPCGGGVALGAIEHSPLGRYVGVDLGASFVRGPRLRQRLLVRPGQLTETAAADGYTVHVRFEDGTSADVDLSYVLDYGGVFEPLRDPHYFRQLRADREAGTIVWPNQADIAPETLFAHAQRDAAATA